MVKYRHSSRNKARRRAIDTIFEANLRGLDRDPERIRQLVAQRCQITTAQTTLPPYAQEIAQGVADHIFEIDDLIDDFAKDWALDRLAATDLAIMRCAVWEIKYNDQVPWRTAVDEAVTISCDISTDQSPIFLNAVLDRLSQAIERGEDEAGSLLSQSLADLPASAPSGADLPSWEEESLFESITESDFPDQPQGTENTEPVAEDPREESFRPET